MNCEVAVFLFPIDFVKACPIVMQLSLFYSMCYEVYVIVTTVRKVILFVSS